MSVCLWYVKIKSQHIHIHILSFIFLLLYIGSNMIIRVL